MQPLTDPGRQKIDELARRYGVSTEAVMALLHALINGNGSMAQFHHPELGGSGQWMRGGMTMISDMTNYELKFKVDGLCSQLSQLLAQQPFVPPPSGSRLQWQGGQQRQPFGPESAAMDAAGSASLFVPPAPGRSGSWWPADLGSPSSSGAQDRVRFAYFGAARRLAVEIDGHVTVYDTLAHQIGGVSQQQGSGASLTFTSQYGTVPIASLPVLSVDGVAPTTLEPGPAPPGLHRAETAQEADIFAKIERLADLQRKGVLSPEEFAAKKAELLGRI